MLSEKSVVTTIPVVDIERAKNFYENKLELKLLEEMDEGFFLKQAIIHSCICIKEIQQKQTIQLHLLW